MKNLNHKLCQFIVKKYVKSNINWAREIKIAQKLVRKFKEFNFWGNLQELKSPPPSLAWFLKQNGKAFLLGEYEKFKLNLNKPKIILDKNKISEDKKICKKPKTLVEFIRYGQKT